MNLSIISLGLILLCHVSLKDDYQKPIENNSKLQVGANIPNLPSFYQQIRFYIRGRPIFCTVFKILTIYKINSYTLNESWYAS